VLKVDDPIDAGALHGCGGIAGSILTGIFASAKVSAYDGFTVIPGGWIDQNYIQMGYQLAGSVTITACESLFRFFLSLFSSKRS
jgi:Amt family ammonium transporter